MELFDASDGLRFIGFCIWFWIHSSQSVRDDFDIWIEFDHVRGVE